MSKGKRKLIGFLVLVPALYIGGLFLPSEVYHIYARYLYLTYIGFALVNGVEHLKDIIEYLKTRGK